MLCFCMYMFSEPCIVIRGLCLCTKWYMFNFCVKWTPGNDKRCWSELHLWKVKNMRKGQCFCSYTFKISPHWHSNLAYFLRTHILSMISFFLKPFPLGSVATIVNQTCKCLINTFVSQVKWLISWKLSCIGNTYGSPVKMCY